MRRVLVALKERRQAAHLAAVTTALVAPGDEVDVVHVIETGSHQDARADVTMVEGLLELLRARGLVARGEVTPLSGGGVAGRLAEWAERTVGTGAERW